MKHETLFLKIVIFLIGLPILPLCLWGLPWFAKGVLNMYPDLAYILYFLLFVLYASAIPYFFALYQTLRLLSYIDKNQAFSDLSVKALKNIKCSAIIITGFYLTATPLSYFIAEVNDAPGIIVLGMIITFCSVVIAVFAAVLQKLLENAIDIKSENDLTV